MKQSPPSRHLAAPDRSRGRAALIAAASLALASSGALGQSLHLLEPPPGFLGVQPVGISSDGSVVGGAALGDWVNGPSDQPLLWSASGGSKALGDLPGSALAWGTGLSGDGSTLIGNGYIGLLQPFRYQNGNYEFLQLPPNGLGLEAMAVNYDGSVIAGTLSTQSSTSGYNWSAFRWTPAGVDDLGYLPNGTYSFGTGISFDGNVIAGIGGTPKGERAFRWTPGGSMEVLDPLRNSDWVGATFVSGDGSTILGYSGLDAVRWVGSQRQRLGRLDSGPNSFAVAYGSTLNGSLIGGTSYNENFEARAFVWNDDVGMVDLNAVLAEQGVDLGGWTLEAVTAISADGSTMVGVGQLNGEYQGWILKDFVNPVPEAAPGVTGAGLVALALGQKMRRRRRA